MGKTSDIMQELADIGALGNKAPEPVVRRLAAVPAFTFLDAKPSPVYPAGPSVPPSALLAGFGEQLASLEVALQGMLVWCANARELAQEYEREEEPAAEVESTAVAEAPEESVAPKEEPVLEAPTKPKYTKEELKKLFLDPTYKVEDPNAAVAAPTTAENPHE